MELETKKIPGHKTFVATIIVNGLVGLADIVVATFFIFQKNVINILERLAYGDGTLGKLAVYIKDALLNLSTHSHRVAVWYFLSHGIIKIFLTWALLRNKLWAYPLAILFFSIFSFYQLTSLPDNHSIFDLILLFVNLIVLVFVAREYVNMKRKV